MIKEMITSYPTLSIILIGLAVTFVSMLISKLMVNQNRIRELKEVQKACQLKLKDQKGKPEKMMEIQKQRMECSMEMMKYSFKPMLITFIPLLLIFAAIRNTFAATEIAKTWIWWYIGTSLVSSFAFRKILRMA